MRRQEPDSRHWRWPLRPFPWLLGHGCGAPVGLQAVAAQNLCWLQSSRSLLPSACKRPWLCFSWPSSLAVVQSSFHSRLRGKTRARKHCLVKNIRGKALQGAPGWCCWPGALSQVRSQVCITWEDGEEGEILLEKRLKEAEESSWSCLLLAVPCAVGAAPRHFLTCHVSPSNSILQCWMQCSTSVIFLQWICCKHEGVKFAAASWMERFLMKEVTLHCMVWCGVAECCHSHSTKKTTTERVDWLGEKHNECWMTSCGRQKAKNLQLSCLSLISQASPWTLGDATRAVCPEDCC